jgi:hypothetical protein
MAEVQEKHPETGDIAKKTYNDILGIIPNSFKADFSLENLEVLKIAASFSDGMEKTKENYLELILLLQGTTFINRSILKRA